MKPILLKLDSFDAAFEKLITFRWNGNQIKSNSLIVRNNTTNQIIYQNTQTSMKPEHLIPSNRLSNGTLYNVTVTVTDYSNTVSEASAPLLFYCYSTPVFTLNMRENQMVQNSVYDLVLSYSQKERETLQSYQVYLCGLNKNIVYDSKIRYNTQDMSLSLSGLEDKQQYYVRATGITLNGMLVDTGYILFSVNYIIPNAYFICYLDNKQDDGMIQIKSNIISIEGKSNQEPSYINGEYLDLNQNKVWFDEGFEIKNDFTLNLKGYGFQPFSTLLYMRNQKDMIQLAYRKGIFKNHNNTEKIYCELLLPAVYSNYSIISNCIDFPDSDDLLSIWVKRKDNYYDVIIKNTGKAVTK